jgi:hypothetical protein
MVRDNEYHKTATRNGSVAVEAPAEDYERRMAIEEARRALDKIKEPMRSCLLLKQQGLSYREIAISLSLKRRTSAVWWPAVGRSLRGCTVRSEADDDTVFGRGNAAKLFRRRAFPAVDGKRDVAFGFVRNVRGSGPRAVGRDSA